MDLYNIMLGIAGIENRLAEGLIDFSYDNLDSAIKSGHPADLLDDIISPVGNAVCYGKEVSKEDLLTLQSELKSFNSAFQIKALNGPIKHLDEYISSL